MRVTKRSFARGLVLAVVAAGTVMSSGALSAADDPCALQVYYRLWEGAPYSENGSGHNLTAAYDPAGAWVYIGNESVAYEGASMHAGFVAEPVWDHGHDLCNTPQE